MDNVYGYPGYPANIAPGTTEIAGVPWVSTIDEVKSASVFYGKRMFMSRNSDIFYMKDANGTVRAFTFKEITLPSNNPEDYVSRAEFDDLRSKYEQLINAGIPATQYAQPIQPVQPAPAISTNTIAAAQPNANNANDAELQWNAGSSQATAVQPDAVNGMGGTADQQLP